MRVKLNTQKRETQYIQLAFWLVITLALSGCGTNPSPTSTSPSSTSTNLPPTFDGKWTGTAGGAGMHVTSVDFEKNEFPCKGLVGIQYGSGQAIMFDLTAWEKEGEQLIGSMGSGKDKVVVATAKLTGSTLSGRVTPPPSPIVGLGGTVEFSGFTKQANVQQKP